MQTEFDIGVFERSVTLKWALVRLKHHVVTSPVTSPQKRKHETEIILFEIFGATTKNFIVYAFNLQILGANGQNGHEL